MFIWEKFKLLTLSLAFASLFLSSSSLTCWECSYQTGINPEKCGDDMGTYEACDIPNGMCIAECDVVDITTFTTAEKRWTCSNDTSFIGLPGPENCSGKDKVHRCFCTTDNCNDKINCFGF